ncbi:MAG: hypothetical protein M0Z84_04515 [Gammaproteobacteria bacterium]|nr:hypothetical protein [Gammaproteobacteria bacterium]
MSPDTDSANARQRQAILDALRHPGPKADLLIAQHLGLSDSGQDCKPYTQDVETALSLLPPGVYFHCGRFAEGALFWCDVGNRPQVQAWGETLAAAMAGGIFAYLTHPELPPGPAAPATPTDREDGADG